MPSRDHIRRRYVLFLLSQPLHRLRHFRLVWMLSHASCLTAIPNDNMSCIAFALRLFHTTCSTSGSRTSSRYAFPSGAHGSSKTGIAIALQFPHTRLDFWQPHSQQVYLSTRRLR